MRTKSVALILSLILVFLTVSAAFAASAYAASPDEFTYTVYLNTAPAFQASDKAAGRVNIVSVRIDYDPDRLELISDFNSNLKAIFPKLGGAVVVNSPEPGKLYFNTVSIIPLKFENDSDILASLDFRYKKTPHRADICIHILELVTEKAAEGEYEYLVKNDVFSRGGIRLSSSITPEGAGVPGEYIVGDADGDGAVTSSDAACIQRSLGYIPIGFFDSKAADADRDGSVTPMDATCVQRYTVHLSDTCSVGKKITG